MMMESMMIGKGENEENMGKMAKVGSSSSRSSTPTSSSKSKRARLTFPFGACRVCTDSATGIHYGIATCEGCKGFFKRSILRKEKYRCYFDNSCLINVTNRNRCKACRFRRCINEGMSVDGVKMGRIPKLVKERALRELKEEQMRQEAILIEANERADEVRVRGSSCSSLSDRSIENYDPDVMEIEMTNIPSSSVRGPYGLTKFCADNNSAAEQVLLVNDQRFNRSTNLSQYDINAPIYLNQRKTQPLTYQAKHPTFLPDDFTLDETVGLTEHSTGPLSHEVFKHAISVSDKLSQNKSSLTIHLTEDEATFIRFLRWSSCNIYHQYSKRVKQLELQMHHMIRDELREYPGDQASSDEFFTAVRRSLTALVRSCVFHAQELPGMTNMHSAVLQKLILHRAFDWFMLKYACLLNKNGQCYLFSTDRFQCTRYWMNIFYGTEMTDAMFEFSQSFHELNLEESELALIIPLQMLHPDSTMPDEEIPRMLRACYLYALYEQLCQNRGAAEGRALCSRVLQMLDQLIPINHLYEKNVGSRVLQV